MIEIFLESGILYSEQTSMIFPFVHQILSTERLIGPGGQDSGETRIQLMGFSPRGIPLFDIVAMLVWNMHSFMQRLPSSIFRTSSLPNSTARRSPDPSWGHPCRAWQCRFWPQSQDQSTQPPPAM